MGSTDPVEMARAVGDRIARLRVALGETQQDLARAVGVSAGTPSRWERGTVLPSTPQLLAIAQRYAVSMEYLLLGGSPHEQLASLPDFTAFLDTSLGRLALERGWLTAIGAMVTRLPQPPTLELYRAIAQALAFSDRGSDDGAK